MRLIDYSYILDLKFLVNKSKTLFEGIFSDWVYTMMLFDTLGRFRNALGHNPKEVLKHQHYLCLGMCGEFQLMIEHWNKGFSRQIQSYSADFTFEELERTDPEMQKILSIKAAENWLNTIKNKSVEDVKVEQNEQYNQIYKIRLREGYVDIAFPSSSRQFYKAGYTQSTNIHIMNTTKSVIARILKEQFHRYWTLTWTLSEQINISLLVSIVELNGYGKPSDTSALDNTITSASYYIFNDSQKKIRVDISSSSNHLTATKITLVYDDGEPNAGFSAAHDELSPDIILSILYG